MAQSARDARLENRANRLKLAKGQRYYRTVGKGLTLVYRRTDDGFGTWSVKLINPATGRYRLEALGAADDYQDADDKTILSFFEAQDKARGIAEAVKTAGGITAKKGSTVSDAVSLYLEWFRSNEKKSMDSTGASIRAHIIPDLGKIKLSELTEKRIKAWLNALANSPARVRTSKLAVERNHKPAPVTADQKRARRATANRVLTILKAILNHAQREEKLILSDAAWRSVEKFKHTEEVRVRFLSAGEAARLVNACQPDLRALVKAALCTGARYSELAGIQVRDVDLISGNLYLKPGKSGRKRDVPLNDDALDLFRDMATGKTGDALVFHRPNGHGWKKNAYVRALREACEMAKIKPAVRFHELRHCFGSALAQRGVPLHTIATLMGHRNIRITARFYAHLCDQTLRDAVSKLPSMRANRHEILVEVPRSLA